MHTSELHPLGRRPQILAVDDNPANLKILSQMLDSLGYDVRFASNGARALNA